MAASAKRKVVPLSDDPGRPASLGCIIEVEGEDRGKRGHGRPKVTLRRPVREFLRSSDYYHRAVFKHLKGCDVCDPAEALEGFLKSRRERNLGVVTTSLLKVADKYKRKFKDRIPDGLHRQFLMACLHNNLQGYLERIGELSEEDVVQSVALLEAGWRETLTGLLRKAKRTMRASPRNRDDVGDFDVFFELYPAYETKSSLARPTPLEKQALEAAGEKGRILEREVSKYSLEWVEANGGPEFEEIRKILSVLKIMTS